MHVSLLGDNEVSEKVPKPDADVKYVPGVLLVVNEYLSVAPGSDQAPLQWRI